FSWINEETTEFLRGGYIAPDEDPTDRLAAIVNTSAALYREMGAPAEVALEYSDKLFDYLSKNFYSLSSPIWANFGKPRGLPISCFGSHVEDTMDSILRTAHEIGMMSKFGGGTAAYFGELRGRGA